MASEALNCSDSEKLHSELHSEKASNKNAVQDLDLGDVRSTSLSVFLLFSFSPTDSRDFIKALESVDTKYTQTVNVAKFMGRFCGEHSAAFRVIINSFFDLCCPKSKKSLQLNNEEDLNKEKLRKEMRANPSYVLFTCFLLFFMTIPDQNIGNWLYWIAYSEPGKIPGVEKLCFFSESLWGKSKTEEQKKLSDLRNVKMRSVLDLIKMAEFSGEFTCGYFAVAFIQLLVFYSYYNPYHFVPMCIVLFAIIG